MECCTGLDADQQLLQSRILSREIMRIIGCSKRQTGLGCDPADALEDRQILRHIVILYFEIIVVFAEQRRIAQRSLLCGIIIARGELA